MSEEKKMSLADLGIEDDTPAEKAEKMAVKNDGETKIETITADDPQTKTKSDKTKSSIVRPLTADGQTQYGETIVDVNKIAKNPIKPKKDPTRETLDGFYALADKGLERTKKDMLAPGGRIDEAKKKYIAEKYSALARRAKNHKKVAEHIKAVNEIIDTDPRFDGISDYERKGYILFMVAKDTKSGVDNGYFGIEEVKKDTTPRLSSDANVEIDKITATDEADVPIMDDETVTIGENKTGTSVLPPDSSDDLNITDPADEEDLSDEISDDDDQISVPASNIPESQAKEIWNEYRHQVTDALKLDRNDDLEGFTVSTKPITLNSALKAKPISPLSFTWGLQYTGTSFEMTPYSGDEIITLNPQNTSFSTVSGLKTIFSTIYHHILNQNKAPFETWLKQISAYDIDCLLFGIYAASFKDTNYVTYECPNPKCKKIFLEKKDIMDMVVFPNDESEKRFKQILAKDTVSNQMYKTHPRIISKNYAIGFVTRSVYSELFEPAALSEDFAKKYSSIIDIMPNIDRVYYVDYESKRFNPIAFGIDENSISKTVMRKVRTLDTIFKTFTPDERALAIAESKKILTKFDQDQITYCIPATVCPTCGEPIPRRVANPLNLLFTRAQLPIVAAYTPE